MIRPMSMLVAYVFALGAISGCGSETPSQNQPLTTEVQTDTSDGSGTTGDVVTPEQPLGGSGSR
ncbi:hypothetical protein [Aporhodopirellula aestuarii]|uniref:Secreted protein n=1 Tax=Aporhodopirellula aestuarii TaxID=2950107 RepID=A0ABT0U006_9BACT|nr:hypothetical protein [Aporhodopirellula aestuarii]MCM2370198.1 hypothetical protein [Aporhodopirellula aestuarii]